MFNNGANALYFARVELSDCDRIVSTAYYMFLDKIWESNILREKNEWNQ